MSGSEHSSEVFRTVLEHSSLSLPGNAFYDDADDDDDDDEDAAAADDDDEVVSIYENKLRPTKPLQQIATVDSM